MPRPPLDLHQLVRNVLQHTAELPPQASCPIQHFERSANVGLSLIKYVDDHIDPGDIYEAVYTRHLGHLRRMVLAELIESFERFLKELASVCVDHLAPYMADDRFDGFVPRRGGQLSAFVNASSIGRALCESDTWLNNQTINERFRLLLQDHFGDCWGFLFPGPTQTPAAERETAATLGVLWQMRHNLAHNLGMLTHSDSMKLRVLVGGPVAADCRLSPSSLDLRYVKRFLAETANRTNERVGQRLTQLLERLHTADDTLFDAQAKANDVSRCFNFSVTINGSMGVI